MCVFIMCAYTENLISMGPISKHWSGKYPNSTKYLKRNLSFDTKSTAYYALPLLPKIIILFLLLLLILAPFAVT